MIEDKRTFLIVDDECACREAFRIALEDEYNLIEAETGEKALEILQRREKIDLVLLDFLLPPGIDGLKVLERMRELNCEVPVIVVTGKGTEEVCRSAFKMGVRDYIQKPFKVNELRETIKRVCGSPEVRKSHVDQAIEFMEEHYCQPVSASDVAQGVGLSYPHLARLFKTEKCCSIDVWLNELRIDKAQVLLGNSNLEIREIATKVGFNDQNYFGRVFKKHTGTSPLEYRKQFVKNDFSTK
ncbi:MAG: response regulator [Gemmatimonadota bacterium]|nr:MAG: response regulator [Gemmatimonadota bacterium]